jgi:2-oxoglutarate dehydrogenase complex dehydrogenase (E1) component-like enzyme
MGTDRIKISASKAADALSNFTSHIQDAFDEAAAAIKEIVPENVEDTVEARLKEVEEAVKAIDEIKTQFDETDWDAVTKASEFDPDDFDANDFIKRTIFRTRCGTATSTPTTTPRTTTSRTSTISSRTTTSRTSATSTLIR